MLDTALPVHFVEGDGDEPAGGVAIPLQVLENRIAVETQHIGRRMDDPDIGLMRDEPADIRHLARGMGQDGQRRIGQDADRPLEDCASVDGQVMQALLERGGGRRMRLPQAGRLRRSPPDPSEPS